MSYGLLQIPTSLGLKCGDEYSDFEEWNWKSKDIQFLSLRQLIKTNRYEDWQIIRIPVYPFAFKDHQVGLHTWKRFSKALEIARQYQLDIIHTQTEFSLGLGVWLLRN